MYIKFLRKSDINTLTYLLRDCTALKEPWLFVRQTPILLCTVFCLHIFISSYRKSFRTSSSFEHFNCAYLLFAHVNVCLAVDQIPMGCFITEHYGYCSILYLLITYPLGSVTT
jgi:hypothetical protein